MYYRLCLSVLALSATTVSHPLAVAAPSAAASTLATEHLFEEPNILCKGQCLNWCKYAEETNDENHGRKGSTPEGESGGDDGEHEEEHREHGGEGEEELEIEVNELEEELEMLEEELEEQEVDIFALGDDLEVEFIAIILVCLIVFSMLCVGILNKVREMTEAWKHYTAVMDKVIEELAILGFISFALTMLESFGIVTHSKILVTFEFTHILIFIFAIVLVIQALNVAAISIRIKRWWTRCHISLHRDPQFFENFSKAYSKHQGSSGSVLTPVYNATIFRVSYECVAVQWYLMRYAFLVRHHKVKQIQDQGKEFDFAMFLEISLNKMIVEFLEFSQVSFAITIFLALAIAVLYQYGYALEHGTGIHLFGALGAAAVVAAVLIWLAAEQSFSKILKYIGCDDVSPESLWNAFSRLHASDYDEIIKSHESLVHQTDTMLKRQMSADEQKRGLIRRNSRKLHETFTALSYVPRTGDRVTITKPGRFTGRVAVVEDPDWNRMVKVVLDGVVKTYLREHIEKEKPPREAKKEDEKRVGFVTPEKETPVVEEVDLAEVYPFRNPQCFHVRVIRVRRSE
jgi:hypothetical protein